MVTTEQIGKHYLSEVQKPSQDSEANNPSHKISTRPPVKMECMKDIEHFIY